MVFPSHICVETKTVLVMFVILGILLLLLFALNNRSPLEKLLHIFGMKSNISPLNPKPIIQTLPLQPQLPTLSTLPTLPPYEDRFSEQRKRDYAQIHDPLYSPQKRDYYSPLATDQQLPVAPVNIPPRYADDEYQAVGYAYNTENEKRLQLFAHRKDNSTDRYEYYVIDKNGIKIPIHNHNYKELYDNDTIHVNGYKGTFIVKIYDNEGPRYIPY